MNPPIEECRYKLYQEMFAWKMVVLSLPRIQSQRYQVSPLALARKPWTSARRSGGTLDKAQCDPTLSPWLLLHTVPSVSPFLAVRVAPFSPSSSGAQSSLPAPPAPLHLAGASTSLVLVCSVPAHLGLRIPSGLLVMNTSRVLALRARLLWSFP